MKVVYGMFDRYDQAKRAMDDFVRAGMPAKSVGVLTGQAIGGDRAMSAFEVPGVGRLTANDSMRELFEASPRSDGVREALIRCGVPRGEVDRYTDEIRRGAVFEAIAVDDNMENNAREIMTRHTRRGEDASLDDIIVPVIREELKIGTREVDAGGVRISSHVREVPVERTVTVREEWVTVERRIIDRPVNEKDGAFQDRTFDLKTMIEEPVVTKHAHVVEEIRVHKDRNERVEKISDTLRHTDVQLSDLPGERMFDATHYREHFAKTYGDRFKLETIAPAYEFGERLSRRTPTGDWTLIETEARSSWERKNPGTWDKVKDAVLAGWDRLRKR